MKKLVLDLDETLICSSTEPFCPECVELSADGMKFYTSFRPGVRQFVAYVAKHFECWIWSTGRQPYLETIAEYLDIKDMTLWGRDFCVRTDRSEIEPYEKPLRRICDDLTQIAIIDNTPSVFSKTPQNGIIIRTWRGDVNDTELDHLSHYLAWLAKQPSMQRDHSSWRLETLAMRSGNLS